MSKSSRMTGTSILRKWICCPTKMKNWNLQFKIKIAPLKHSPNGVLTFWLNQNKIITSLKTLGVYQPTLLLSVRENSQNRSYSEKRRSWPLQTPQMGASSQITRNSKIIFCNFLIIMTKELPIWRKLWSIYSRGTITLNIENQKHGCKPNCEISTG